MTQKSPKKEAKTLSILEAIEKLWEWQVWPSSANVARLMQRKVPKLNGRDNRERLRILRADYGL